jgi:hypothetical protein
LRLAASTGIKIIFIQQTQDLLAVRRRNSSFFFCGDFGASLKRASEHHFFLDITFY